MCEYIEDICHRLNACVSPEFTCCSWVSHVGVFRGGAFGRWLGLVWSWGWSWGPEDGSDGISVLTRKKKGRKDKCCNVRRGFGWTRPSSEYASLMGKEPHVICRHALGNSKNQSSFTRPCEPDLLLSWPLELSEIRDYCRAFLVVVLESF